jgi:acyl-CoA dehydrogenase
MTAYSGKRLPSNTVLLAKNQITPIKINKGIIMFYEQFPLKRAFITGAASGFGLEISNQLAHAESALNLALDYIKERQAFGQPIAKLQSIRHKIAEMKTQTELHRKIFRL